MSNFRENSKHEFVAFRLDNNEKTKARRLASRVTGGNLSQLFRWFLSNTPDMNSNAQTFGQKETAVLG